MKTIMSRRMHCVNAGNNGGGCYGDLHVNRLLSGDAEARVLAAIWIVLRATTWEQDVNVKQKENVSRVLQIPEAEENRA